MKSKNLDKAIWFFYSHTILTSIILYISGLCLLTVLTCFLNLKWWNYDVRVILKALLDASITKKTPLSIAHFITFLIPTLFPFIARVIINQILFPVKISKVIRALHDRCWEIYKLGHIWLRDSIQNIIDKVDGFRTGLQLSQPEISQIVTSLYETTEARRIFATWLLDINILTPDIKNYMETTHRKIQEINKFQLHRFIIGSNTFDNLFSLSSSSDTKWFVQQHNSNSFSLYYINKDHFIQCIKQCGIDEEKCDVLFFDGSLVFILLIDRNTIMPIMYNNRNTLLITDTNTDKEKYSRFFKELKRNSIDVIEKLKQEQQLKFAFSL